MFMKHLIQKIIAKITFKIIDISFQSRYQGYRDKYDLSQSFKFNENNIQLYGEGEIHIGDNTYISSFTTIQAYKECKVIIGNNCSISHNVKIYTMNRNPVDIIEAKSNISLKTGDVIIGNNCWIGANVFIKEGVSIASNCVVGANSVVTKDISANSIYAGTAVIRQVNREES